MSVAFFFEFERVPILPYEAGVTDPGYNGGCLTIILSISYSRSRFLVRWLSGRKQRFAKAPYPKRVPRVRIPPSPFTTFLTRKTLKVKEMKRFFAGGLLLASALPAGAEDIKVVGEKEYKGVTISRAEPDGLVIVAPY